MIKEGVNKKETEERTIVMHKCLQENATISMVENSVVYMSESCFRDNRNKKEMWEVEVTKEVT